MSSYTMINYVLILNEIKRLRFYTFYFISDLFDFGNVNTNSPETINVHGLLKHLNLDLHQTNL